MIVMLNGSFGVGKTSTATILNQRILNSIIFDPEIIGGALKEMTEGMRTERENTGDFRDISLWPDMVISCAKSLSEQYKKHLIVPMTIDNHEQLRHIRSGFESFSPHVYHFCLTAPLGVVLERIRNRQEGNGPWEIQKATECSANFQGPAFDEYIDASITDPHGVVEHVLTSIGLQTNGLSRKPAITMSNSLS